MTTRERRWYREPMVWLVLAFPLAAVIAGLSTLAIAIRSGGSDAVPAEVRRSAQIQIADLAADAHAARLGLIALATVELDTGAVRLELSAPADIDATGLSLALIHPTRAREDQRVALTRSGDRWLGRLSEPDPSHDWLLRLEPGNRHWRLHGRLAAGASETRLMPALPAH